MRSKAKRSKGLVATATAAASTQRRREKENMTEFIMKKRSVPRADVAGHEAEESELEERLR